MLTNPRTFRCPNCKEMINDSMTQCRYCSVPIDPGVADSIATQQEQANQACSDASYLRIAAIAMFVFLGLNLIPFLPVVYWGFLITFIVVIVLMVRWQLKFGNLVTNDPDYKLARRARTIALVLLIIAIPLGFVVRPLLSVIISVLTSSAG